MLNWLQFGDVPRTAENQNVGSANTMKSRLTESQKEALTEARQALYDQQYGLIQSITRIQTSIDAAIEAGKEADAYDKDILVEAKAKLATAVMARETLTFLY